MTGIAFAARGRRAITERQREVARWIAAYIDRHHGIAPLQREIAEGCGYTSTAIVREMLRKLDARGLIVRDPKAPRNLRVTEEGRR